jgi:hypothetical protein
MSVVIRIIISCALLHGVISAQTYTVSLEKKTGYNGWTTGWDMVYAVKNDIVTVAIVPKLGGRVMQYDLGANKSLYIYNSSQTPTSGNDVVGGFRVLPSPQSDFVWPSPPNLDFNPYTCTEQVNNADSAVIYLESQVENSTDSKYQKHKGLQFKRLITIYKASTQVKVEMTMLNKGTQTMTHGIWDITQTAASGSNCWVYFQRNPSSTLGGGKGYVQYMNEGTDATQWKPDAADGNIMGVQYLKKVGKIGADCKAGWICFNDRQSGYAYVKTFTYQEGKTYPDSGASVQVYTYANNDMVEVEVLGPLDTLAPGDSTKLIENWYAARSSGPVLAVNKAGLITNKLSIQKTADVVSASGTFGVFLPGTVKMQFCNAAGSVVAVADSVAVTPADSLRINKQFALSPSASEGALRLAAFDVQGNLIGILDSAASPIPAVGLGYETKFQSASNQSGKRTTVFRLKGTLRINVPFDGTRTTTVFSIDGKRLASFTGEAPYRHSINVSTAASEVLLVRIEGAGMTETRCIGIPGGR